MKRNLITVALAGVISLSATAALADDADAYQGSWYALAGASTMHPDSDLDADNSVGGFLRLGQELSQHWDIQLGGSYTRADEDLNAANAGGRYKQTLLGMDALYMFSRERFRPFVLAGLGLARNDVDYHVAGANVGGEKTSWMANVGAGAQFMLTEAVGVQADARYVWSRAEVQGGPLTSSHDETIGNTYLNIGGIIKFGAPKQMAVAEPEPAPVAAAPEPAPEPAPVAEPPPAPAAFEKITLASEVLFAFDKDTLRAEGKQLLDNDVVVKMKAHPEVELVLISGYTDRIGSAGYNQKLSERRANNVKEYLISQGIEENRLHAVGKGESDQVADCKGMLGKEAIDCLQPNRRVVVEIEEQR